TEGALQTGRELFFEVEQVILIRRTLPLDQHDIAFDAETTDSRDAVSNIKHLEKARAWFFLRPALHSRDDLCSLRLGNSSVMFPVDTQCALPPAEHGVCIQERFSIAVLDLKAQIPDEAGHLLFLKCADMSLHQRLNIHLNERVAQRQRV